MLPVFQKPAGPIEGAWYTRFRVVRKLLGGRWEYWWRGSIYGDLGSYAWMRVEEWSTHRWSLWEGHRIFGNAVLRREAYTHEEVYEYCPLCDMPDKDCEELYG